MKYCTHCGHELLDEAVMCPYCGCMVNPPIKQEVKSNGDSTLLLIAFIVGIIGLVGTGLTGLGCLLYTLIFSTVGAASSLIITLNILGLIFLIPLIYSIPMTIKINKARKNNTKLSTCFKVCYLIFVNQISGILLLCVNDD